MDAVDAYLAGKPKPAPSLLAAFANTAKALRQFGIPRIRVVGLSRGCDTRPTDGVDPADGVSVVTEQQFMRDFVFRSRPAIILDAMEDWPAMQKWRSDRHVFDLDHRLPLVEQHSSSSSSSDGEEEEEEEDDDNGHDNAHENKKKNEEDEHVHELGKRDADAGPGASRAAHERHRLRDHLGGNSNAPLTEDLPPGAVPAPLAPTPHGKTAHNAVSTLGPKKFTIALCPNGRADAVTYVMYDDRDVPDERKDDTYAGAAARKAAVPLRAHPALPPNIAADERAHLRLEKIFMYAAEIKLTLPELYKLFSRGPMQCPPHATYVDMRTYKRGGAAASADDLTPVIAYAQLQNNCLNTQFTHVHADIKTNVEAFGTRVFGASPEAANVWLGVPASVSSMHQDWVENLYPVIRGVKEFVLVPPWEGVFVPKPDVPAALFALDEMRTDRDQLTFAFRPYPEKDGSVVPWMDFDFTPDVLEQENGEDAVLDLLNRQIEESNSHRTPIDPKLAALSSVSPTSVAHDAEGSVQDDGKKLKALHPLVAYVRPGEVLYLPAMWLHRVAQHADEQDIRARARHLVEKTKAANEDHASPSAPAAVHSVVPEEAENDAVDKPPLPLIAAVNYWYDMSFTNPAVVMLREFGLLL